MVFVYLVEQYAATGDELVAVGPAARDSQATVSDGAGQLSQHTMWYTGPADTGITISVTISVTAVEQIAPQSARHHSLTVTAIVISGSVW